LRRGAFSAIWLESMPPALETLKFYYDYKSPFTYLALEPTLDLERTHHVKLHFIPLEVDLKSAYGGELPQRTERDWYKVRYLYADARRFANDRGLTIRGPQKLFDSRLALIGGLYADAHGRFSEYSSRVFERFFKRELNIEEPAAIAAVLEEVGLNAADFREYAESRGIEALSVAAKEAERDGIFGVPMLLVGGEPFWGNDRVDWAIKKLDKMGLRRASSA
jgi:2-hydroxychromene-2-carboxylate isomerase